MWKKYSVFLWPLLLVLITVIICFRNYTPGTWLTGWDTLHPEFDFSLHITRSIFGVWREDQGLGTLAAHSHMSELPRIIILWLLSLAFPLNSLRYLYIFGCFILGPLGIYVFVRQLIPKNKNSYFVDSAAFLAALFYIFNLVTVQQFYVIFEMFAVQYAAIGWLFWLGNRYFDKGKKKDAFFFFFVSFLAAPMAYASVLWFAYIACLALYYLGLFLSQRNRTAFLRALTIGILSILANGFWLFPNFYFLLTSAAQVPNLAHINRLFSPESFLHNEAYGDIFDVAILKNFLFNWLQFKSGSTFVLLLQVWQSYLNNFLVVLFGYFVFIISIIGMGLSIRGQKTKLLSLLPLFLFCFFMLTNANPPLGFLFIWFRDHVNLFAEGLRTPFTKFSIIYIFVMAIYLGIFLEWCMNKIAKKTSVALTLFIFPVLLSVGFILYGWPMFNGYLINPGMRIDIPQTYFDFYSWVKTQPTQARFALLPLETYTGWQYYNWGYEGAGFIWFGMPQPISVRDFDRWSPYNETFYNQLSQALYGGDTQQFGRVLTQYDIQYLLLDESIVAPGHDQAYLHNEEIKKDLLTLGATQVWHQDFLSVYKFPIQASNFITVPAQYSFESGNANYVLKDPVYQQQPNYLTQLNSNSNTLTQTIYPFADLQKSVLDSVVVNAQNITVNKNVNVPSSNYSLKLPQWTAGQTYPTQLQITYSEQEVSINFPQRIQVQVGSQIVSLPQLPSVTFTINGNPNQLVLDVAGREIQLTKNQSDQLLEAPLKVGSEIPISYFDLAAARNSNGQLTIDEKNLNHQSIPASVWQPIENTSSIPIKSGNAQIKLTFTAVPTDIKPPSPNSLINCDNFKRGEIQESRQDGTLTYIAQNHAIACDGISLPNATYQVSHLIHWVGTNTSGRSIKLYLLNQASGHNDIEELLPEKNFDTSYLIPSTPNLPEDGYYLSYETASFGQPDGQNSVSKLDLYPFPSDYLASITLQPTNVSPTSNSLRLISNKRIANFLYTANVMVSQNSGIISLSQGYEEGWLSFELTPLPHFFPHFQFNGWANAWEIPQGDHRLIILYWPQLLSFAGYAGLGGAFIFFAICLLQPRKKLRFLSR